MRLENRNVSAKSKIIKPYEWKFCDRLPQGCSARRTAQNANPLTLTGKDLKQSLLTCVAFRQHLLPEAGDTACERFPNDSSTQQMLPVCNQSERSVCCD
jgi:hypothetical protein